MAPPNLSDYQAAATAIYQPQDEAEAAQLTSTRDQTINTLESGKAQIGTDYQSAIDKLTQSVQDQTGQINQLYSQRLGGNFSGLQGNDLGQMFSRANDQQSIIEQTRANKLADITTSEDNAQIQYATDWAGLGSKYQSLEDQYAQSAYGTAVKDYQTQENSDRTYNLDVAKFENSAGNSENSASNAAASGYKASAKGSSTNNGYDFTGPNGQPISLAEYLQGASQGNGGVWTQTALDILKNGTSYDKSIYNIAAKAYAQHGDVAQAITNADTKNAYGLRQQ